MKRRITISLQFDLAIGKVNLNEIVYRLKELRDPLMLSVLEGVLKSCDDLISKRLSQTKIYTSKFRKGLGRHLRKDDPKEQFCRGRKIRKRGYCSEPRRFSSVFGALDLRIQEVFNKRPSL